ncbi:phosphodiester glycosidase family protein, partial [Microcoleus sp. herbarium8]|uniref:phosphodiester glycosidase family protein n=1 Tax=Microcoleus sp. herbarium8 TaxID=3055436 RepID=UPI002FD4679F
EFNNESAIAPWNASLEPTQAIIPQLDANGVVTGGVGEEVNMPTLTPEAYDNIILPDASLTRMASGASTDSNSSLPDSSVDLLTGEAMSEVYGDLTKFAAGADFAAKLNVPFGENWDAAAAKALAEEWFQGDFSDIPPLKVVSSAEIGGANGAFAAATDTIYLSKEFLTQNGANPAAVADVLLEEIGHSVDARLNVTDSPGDEGAIFGAVVQGKELSEGELQGLKSKDDTATVLFNGQSILIEKAAFDFQNKWAIQAWNGNMNSNTWEPVSWSGNNARGFGSNTRSDGKKGFAADWGDGSPGEGINKDNFLLGLWTQADFEKDQSYKFKVRADDSYYIAALPVNGNKWELINWEGKEDAYGGKEIQWKPENNGKYWVFSYFRERDAKAYFDISWQKDDRFTSVKNSTGVNLYESSDKSDYVQVVDLSQGAAIKLLTGQQKDNSGTSGAYGGNSPKFKRESIDTFWNKLSSDNPNAFSVSNGAFFTSGPKDILAFGDTNLSYPLKADSQIFDGSENNNQGSKLKLEIWNDRASITQFNDNISSISDSSASQVIVGLPKQTKEQNQNSQELNSRTYVGIKDSDYNGSNETVLILTSKNTTTTDAIERLKYFGANEIMQLDGSGSTQMKAQGNPYVQSTDPWPIWPRYIPQAIGVISG